MPVDYQRSGITTVFGPMTWTGAGVVTVVNVTVEVALQQVVTTQQRRFLRRKFLAGRRQQSVSHAVGQQATGAGWQQTTTVGWQTTTGAGQQAT